MIEGKLKLIFGSEFLHKGVGGIGRYASNLICEIGKLNKLDNTEYYFNNKLYSDVEVIAPNHNAAGGNKKLNSLLSESYYLYLLRHYIRSNTFKTRTRKLDGYIYHEPAFIARPFYGPTVVTVHDMSHICFPQYHPAGRVKYLEKYLPITLSNVDHIITHSKFIRSEIIEYLGVPDSRITAIPLGVGSMFKERTESEVSATLNNYDLNYSGYILSVATLEGRKNIDGLIKAYSNLPDSLKKQFPLVLVGSVGWKIAPLYELLRKYKAASNIRLLGAVTDEQLVDIYSGAKLFVYPSWYEGFGLPPLEAMSCGTPVITSKNTVLEEVVGDSAKLVVPGDTESLTEAIEHIVDDDVLQNEMALSGLKRAQLYTWKKCAEKTVAVYNNMARNL